MMRSTARRISQQRAVDVVVVGGGLTGCLVAARLAHENLTTMLLEEGTNTVDKPKWHRQIGCALYAHRHGQRGYEAHYQTVPQRPLWPTSDAADKQAAASGGEGSDAQTVVTPIPSPRLLGGSGIMGSRSWFFGDAADWDGMPWTYRNDIAPRVQRMESTGVQEPHRGKYGKFPVTRATALSPYYQPFATAFNTRVPLTSSWNRLDLTVKPGCGRPDVFVDPTSRLAHNTLDTYLIQSVTLKRPIGVKCDAKVTKIIGNGKGSASGVQYIDRDGALQTINSSIVVLAAGTIGSSKLAQGSAEALLGAQHHEINPHIGKGFWDCPSVVLQFQAKNAMSHNVLMNPAVQCFAYLQQLLGFAPPALSSSYDDLFALWSSTGSQVPDVKFFLQPFTLDVHGKPLENVEHGFQIVVQLARPKSRGVLTQSSTDPNYFADAADRTALQKGVELIRELVKSSAFQHVVAHSGKPIAELFESRGINGGGLCAGSAVDEQTFLLKGSDNVYVCDGSLLGNPLIGDRTPSLLALSDKFADRYLNKSDVVAKKMDLSSLPGSNEVRIIY